MCRVPLPGVNIARPAKIPNVSLDGHCWNIRDQKKRQPPSILLECYRGHDDDVEISRNGQLKPERTVHPRKISIFDLVS